MLSMTKKRPRRHKSLFAKKVKSLKRSQFLRIHKLSLEMNKLFEHIFIEGLHTMTLFDPMEFHYEKIAFVKISLFSNYIAYVQLCCNLCVPMQPMCKCDEFFPLKYSEFIFKNVMLEIHEVLSQSHIICMSYNLWLICVIYAIIVNVF